MKPLIVALARLALPVAADAQTANASPRSGAGAGGGSVTRTAPSGGTGAPNSGQPQVGAPTPPKQREDLEGHKDTAPVCKGC